MRIVALIPCYNAEKHCGKVIEKTLAYVDRLIVINDGSTDHTGDVLRGWEKREEKIDLIDLKENQGKGSALLLGMQKAIEKPFDALITLDADEQHLPKEVPLVAEPIQTGYDFVMGVRDLKKMPLRSKLSNLFIRYLLSLLYKKAPKDTQTGFRAFSFSFAKEVVKKVGGGRYEMEFRSLLFALSNGWKIKSVPITTIYLPNQPSYYRKIYDSFLILRELVRFLRQRS